MNASKTKFMIIRSIKKIFRRNVTLKCLDGTTIEQVENIKYLGVIIDNKRGCRKYRDFSPSGSHDETSTNRKLVAYNDYIK